MRSNNETKNINVTMPVEFYNRLKAEMTRLSIRTNLSFLEHAVKPREQDEVDFSFLIIDNEHPQGHSAIFQIGECVYRFDGLEFHLFPENEARQLLTEYEGVPA